MFIYGGQAGETSNSSGGSNISKGREVYESIQSPMLKYQITFQEHHYLIFLFYINTLEPTCLNG